MDTPGSSSASDGFIGDQDRANETDEAGGHSTTKTQWDLDTLPLVPEYLAALARFQPEGTGIPEDLSNVETIIRNLYKFLDTVERSRSPTQPMDIRLQIFMEGNILDALVDLAMSDRFYCDNHESIRLRREVLATILNCLSYLTRAYERWRKTSQDMSEQQLIVVPVEYVKRQIPKLFQRLRAARHSLLPLPSDDEPPWKLHDKPEREQEDDELLERGVANMVYNYQSIFIESPSEKYLQPSVEGCLLMIHCVARTRHCETYESAAWILAICVESRTFQSANDRLWKTSIADSVLVRALFRQFNMRLRDEMLDHNIRILLGMITKSLEHVGEQHAQLGLPWADILEGVARTLERQECMGAPPEKLKMMYTYVVYLGLDIMDELLPPSKANPEGYQGDISKLDLIGIVARLSPFTLERFEDEIVNNAASFIMHIIQRYITITTDYIADNSHRKLERLRYRASSSIPPALAALKRIRPRTDENPSHPIWLKSVIHAFAAYAKLLGIQYNVLNPASVPYPQSRPIKTCAYSACLCATKKPWHKLRVCTGCHSLYYCSVKCQTLDWERGHSQHCSRWTPRQDSSEE